MLFQRTPLVTALVLAGACSMATAAQADVVRVESGDLTGFLNNPRLKARGFRCRLSRNSQGF